MIIHAWRDPVAHCDFQDNAYRLLNLLAHAGIEVESIPYPAECMAILLFIGLILPSGIVFNGFLAQSGRKADGENKDALTDYIARLDI